MRVNRLKLSGFRCYDKVCVSFDAATNVIIGQNAQGKTSLIEAVYMLCAGKSFRTRLDKEIIGFSRESAELEAEVSAAGRDQAVKLLLKRGYRKRITRNGVKAAPNELSEMLCAVLFCPEDLELIRGGAAERRKLLDLSISQLRPGYAALLTEYNRVYAHKLRILRDYRDNQNMMSTLDSFSENMCKVGARLIRYRASFAAKLGREASAIAAEIDGGERLSIEYKTVKTVLDPRAAEREIFEQLMEHQEAHRKAEIASGACLSGAHKDELLITINGAAARSFASQGQARTAALALKLAEREIMRAETGEEPILLLDDVLSELDQYRQDFVLNRIGGGQTLISCCEDENISKRCGGKVILVKNGEIYA